jgi:hypothetical protein
MPASRGYLNDMGLGTDSDAFASRFTSCFGLLIWRRTGRRGVGTLTLLIRRVLVIFRVQKGGIIDCRSWWGCAGHQDYRW